MIPSDDFFDQRDVIDVGSDDSRLPSPSPASVKDIKQSCKVESPSTSNSAENFPKNELRKGGKSNRAPWELDCSDSGN